MGTFYAAPEWNQSFFGPWALWLDDNVHERVHVLVDPVPSETDYRPGPTPADAESLAQSVLSNPYLDATAPVADSVGGTPALRMDVVAASASRASESSTARTVDAYQRPPRAVGTASALSWSAIYAK